MALAAVLRDEQRGDQEPREREEGRYAEEAAARRAELRMEQQDCDDGSTYNQGIAPPEIDRTACLLF